MQKDCWEKEYKERKDLPSSRTNKPSRALVDFLSNFALENGPALDIGSGMGRNSIYLASLGRKVIGLEIIKHAINEANLRASEAKVGSLVKFLDLSAGKAPWPFKDNEFALALDMMTLHVLDKDERENYAKELVRVLKPGGYFVFYTIASDSPAAQRLFKISPGPEVNSYIIPQTGMIEKGFTREEIEELFSPLKIIKFERKTEFTPAFGDIYERVYYSGVMRKNNN